MRLPTNKKRKYFSLPPEHRISKKLIQKDKRVITANLKLNLYELKLHLFSYKNVSPIASKVFATQSSFTDHL